MIYGFVWCESCFVLYVEKKCVGEDIVYYNYNYVQVLKIVNEIVYLFFFFQ